MSKLKMEWQGFLVKNNRDHYNVSMKGYIDSWHLLANKLLVNHKSLLETILIINFKSFISLC